MLTSVFSPRLYQAPAAMQQQVNTWIGPLPRKSGRFQISEVFGSKLFFHELETLGESPRHPVIPAEVTGVFLGMFFGVQVTTEPKSFGGKFDKNDFGRPRLKKDSRGLDRRYDGSPKNIQKTIQKPNLRRYDWKTRVEDVFFSRISLGSVFFLLCNWWYTCKHTFWGWCISDAFQWSLEEKQRNTYCFDSAKSTPVGWIFGVEIRGQNKRQQGWLKKTWVPTYDPLGNMAGQRTVSRCICVLGTGIFQPAIWAD